MWNWLIENSATLLISLGLAALVISIIVSMVRKHRHGKNACNSYTCASCPLFGRCSSEVPGAVAPLETEPVTVPPEAATVITPPKEATATATLSETIAETEQK